MQCTVMYNSDSNYCQAIFENNRRLLRFSVAFSWPSSGLEGPCLCLFVFFFAHVFLVFLLFSWLLRGPHFGQILRVLAQKSLLKIYVIFFEWGVCTWYALVSF